MERDASRCSLLSVASMILNINFSPIRQPVSIRSLLLLTGSLVYFVVISWKTLVVLEQERDAIRHMTKPSLNQPSERIALSTVQTDAINRAIRQLNLPWDLLFAEVESCVDSQIGLLALEPDALNRMLRIHAETKSADDMFGFIRTLKKSTFLSDAFLVHHEISETDPNRPLRFIVEARWPID
jgi:hypothetical protein